MVIRNCHALLVLVLIPPLVLLSGCSNGECVSGAVMPDSMAKLGIPAVDGASVCKASESFVSLLHHDREAGQLLTAYTEKLRQAGWSASAKQSKEPGFETYEKGSSKLMITAKRCSSPGLSEYFGTCTIVEVWDDTE